MGSGLGVGVGFISRVSSCLLRSQTTLTLLVPMRCVPACMCACATTQYTIPPAPDAALEQLAPSPAPAPAPAPRVVASPPRATTESVPADTAVSRHTPRATRGSAAPITAAATTTTADLLSEERAFRDVDDDTPTASFGRFDDAADVDVDVGVGGDVGGDMDVDDDEDLWVPPSEEELARIRRMREHSDRCSQRMAELLLQVGGWVVGWAGQGLLRGLVCGMLCMERLRCVCGVNGALDHICRGARLMSVMGCVFLFCFGLAWLGCARWLCFCVPRSLVAVFPTFATAMEDAE